MRLINLLLYLGRQMKHPVSFNLYYTLYNNFNLWRTSHKGLQLFYLTWI